MKLDTKPSDVTTAYQKVLEAMRPIEDDPEACARVLRAAAIMLGLELVEVSSGDD